MRPLPVASSAAPSGDEGALNDLVAVMPASGHRNARLQIIARSRAALQDAAPALLYAFSPFLHVEGPDVVVVTRSLVTSPAL